MVQDRDIVTMEYKYEIIQVKVVLHFGFNMVLNSICIYCDQTSYEDPIVMPLAVHRVQNVLVILVFSANFNILLRSILEYCIHAICKRGPSSG